jgi:hypothetical protein
MFYQRLLNPKVQLISFSYGPAWTNQNAIANYPEAPKDSKAGLKNALWERFENHTLKIGFNAADKRRRIQWQLKY